LNVSVSEFELISVLTRHLAGNDSVRVGPGDDCAVLDLGIHGQWLLFKTDAVVEGVHFTREAAPEQIGHKALARCLSDFAAMAGTPTAAVVTLALPKNHDVKFVEAIYAGMNRLAQRHQVAIVGGETTTNPERLLLSLAVIGTVPRERCVLRSGSKPGDAIFVTGTLGGSIRGRHLDFEPRLAEARWLAEHFTVHAMIDLSDGLAGDLRHLLNAANVGADLLQDAIPVSREARLHSREHSSTKAPLAAALSDGEDFELLFTLAARDAVPLHDAWTKQFPDVKLTCIGKITAASGLRLRTRKGLQPITEHGYIHFDKP
jgi:thiamine-monophosphate kinase